MRAGTERSSFQTDNGNAWKKRLRGRFATQFEHGYVGQRKYHLPLIVMPAGSRSAYEQRNNEKATPERIAGKVRMVLELARQGRISGVVTYCLDKRAGSPEFNAVQHVFKAFSDAGCSRKE